MSSGSGSGADQHLLALLRAIRLRQAAPEAAAAGVADVAAALTERVGSDDRGDEGRPGDRPARDAHDELSARPERLGLPVAPSHYVVLPAGGAQSPRPGWAIGTPGEGAASSPAARRDGGHAGSQDVAQRGPAAASGSGQTPGRLPDHAAGPPNAAGSPPAGGNGPTAAGTTRRGRTTPPPGRPVPPGGFFDHGPQLRPAGLPSAAPAGDTEATPPPRGSTPTRPDATPRAPGNAPPPAGTPPLTGGAVQGGAGQGSAGQDGAGRKGPTRPGVTGSGATSARAAGLSAVNPRAIGLGSGLSGSAGGNRVGGIGRGRPAPDPVPGQFTDEMEQAADLAERSWRDRPGPHDPGAEVVERVWRDRPGSRQPIGAVSAIEGPLSGVPEVPPLFGAQPLPGPGLETPGDGAGTPSPHGTPILGEAPTRASESADGMDPADDALLRQTQRLLSTSLTFAGGSDDVAERLRAALLQAYPVVLAALPGNASTQTGQLAQALTWLVHNLDHPPVLVDGCGRLGAALTECGVEPQQLHLVGAALAEAMRAGMPARVWRQDFDLAWRSTWQHAYEWILHGESLVAYQPTVWSAVVVGHELRRGDLAVVRLRPWLPMPFRPGQYARIQVPEVPGVWRPYSLTGSPREDNVLELHVRAKTIDGVSGTLVYRTNVGDRVELSRAEGQMGLPAHPQRDLLLIAGDTGVVPLKALLTELAATDDPRSAVLFWGVRNLAELYDIADIAEIARSAKRATVIPVISEGNPGPYASGLVTDAVAAYGEWSNHEVYLAGPPSMLAATTAALVQLGVSREQIHHDLPE